MYLSTLDHPCSYETKHRTHLYEPQPGCSGQCRSSRPVVCISAPLTTRAATRQNTEHTCINHSLGAAVNVGPVGQCLYLSTLDHPCSYETKHRTHLYEPQPGCSGQCRSSRPVVCISAPLTTRADTRQNTEHTCMNHSLGAAVNVGPVSQSCVSQHP